MVKEIKLTKGFSALVDDVDYEKVSAFRWFAHKGKTNMYACRDEKGVHLQMQNFIYGDVPKGMLVDHKNRNSLDNRKENLRLGNKSQNNANAKFTFSRQGKPTSSKFKGVSWDKREGKWYSGIGVNYKKINLGYFRTEEDAAQAYNFAALKYFGEFATFNNAGNL